VEPARENALLAICARFGLGIYQLGQDAPQWPILSGIGIADNV